jgi:hypothetical protein
MARTRSGGGGHARLRTLALVLAVLIALGSTAAVVLSDDPRVLRVAVVGALWAFVLAAFAGPRRSEPGSADGPGSALELRRTYEIELEKEVAARREYELQLEVYLRRELERGLSEDVAALRDEVARMRGEMFDRLDGELRMERIETTRLIGGSLRALQDEAARLGLGLQLPAELSGPIEGLPVGGSGPSIFDEPRPSSQAPPPPYQPPPPAYQPPAYQPPAYQPPVYQPPAYQPPAYQQPVYEPPVYEPQFEPRQFEPRQFEPRQFEPPQFEPPRFEPPQPPQPPQPQEPPRPQPYQPPHQGRYESRASAPRTPAAGESVPPRRRRAREDGEDNEVLSRLLGR